MHHLLGARLRVSRVVCVVHHDQDNTGENKNHRRSERLPCPRNLRLRLGDYDPGGKDYVKLVN